MSLEFLQTLLIFHMGRRKKQYNFLCVHVLPLIWAELHFCKGCERMNLAHGLPIHRCRQAH